MYSLFAKFTKRRKSKNQRFKRGGVRFSCRCVYFVLNIVFSKVYLSTDRAAVPETGVINHRDTLEADPVLEDMVVDDLILAVRCQAVDVIRVHEITRNLQDVWEYSV